MYATTGQVISRIRTIENKDFETKQFLGLKEVRYDGEVAELLGMSRQSLANYRKNKCLPIKRIVEYGLKNNINLNELLGK